MEYIERNPMQHVVVSIKVEDFLVKEEKRNYWERDEIKNGQFMVRECKNNKKQPHNLLIYGV
ncbi:MULTISPECIES: hypothetical protein [Bacillaceae]|nr:MULTISPECIES: hypothetical protein [Bacillaceae]